MTSILHTIGAALIFLCVGASVVPSAYARGEKGAGDGAANGQSSRIPGIYWDREHEYWRTHYSTRPYYRQDEGYSTYEPAYRYGMEAYDRNDGRAYHELDQEELRKGWEQARGNSSLSWQDAQMATRDAYDRLYNNSSGEAALGSRRGQ